MTNTIVSRIVSSRARWIGAVLALAMPISFAQAAVTTSGDTDWNTSSNSYIAESDGSTGSIVIDDGTTTSTKSFYVGYGDNSTGSLTITGSGTKLSNSTYGRLYASYEGSSTITVSDEASMIMYCFYLGGYSQGQGCTMTVSGGAYVASGSVTRIGYESAAEVLLTGEGTVWEVGTAGYSSARAFVGQGAYGKLTITDGAQFLVDVGLLAYDTDGSGVFLSDGGMLTLAGDATTVTEFLDLVGGDDAIYVQDAAGNDVLLADADASLYTLTSDGSFTTLTAVSVPEPATMSLFGLASLALLRRRK